MSKLFVLFEHAAGYAIFSVREFEEVGMLLPQVEASVTDLSRFNSVVKLIGFSPFKTALTALESINNISEGIAPEDLQLFLDSCIPKSGKKDEVVLGVADPKLGANITEVLNIKCDHTGAIPEIIRGIRFHFHNLVKGFTAKSSGIAQLGLGHSYSRAKVKFNVNRVDNMIIQSIALLDQLDKDINTFSMRIREWYSYHFPELVKIVPENYMYAKVAKLIKNRKELTNEKLEALEEIVMDSAKAQAIIDASKSSMGMDISPVDLLNIEMFAVRVIALADYRKQLAEYLKSKMTGVAPNLATLIGDQVGARLIAHAGSLTNLAKYPASTVQILGAEKALFRALKTRELIVLPDIPTNVFGEKLRQQVEDRLKFYETGEIPKKNIDVMKEALEEAAQVIASMEQKSAKKKKKKDKKRKSEVLENGKENGYIENGVEEETEEPVKKKKKKKKSKSLNENE
ncbi:nucleolar protein 56 [Apis mellifera carnica]|nr:nucleolar protein 56 [Apis mellifera carnica]